MADSKVPSPATRRIVIVMVAVLLLGAGVLIAIPTTSAAWPIEGYDGGRTSATPGDFPERYELAWVFNGSDRAEATIVASPTMVYSVDLNLTTRERFIRAVAVETGEEVWNHSTPPSTYVSPPALAGDFLIVGIHTSIWAFNATTGQVRWNYTANVGIEKSAVVEGERVYAVEEWDNTIYVLNLTTGELLFRHELDTKKVKAWAVRNGVVYYQAKSGRVGAFDTVSNTSLWQYPITQTPNDVSIMVADGKVFAGGSGTVHVLNATNGEFIRSVYVPDGILGILDMAWSENTFVVTAYSVNGAFVLAFPFEGGVGKAWSRPFGSRLAVGDGKVVVQDGNLTATRLLVLDLFTGEQLDEFLVDERASRRTPILSEGRIYFTTYTKLYALQKLRQPDLAVSDLRLTPSSDLRDGDEPRLAFTLSNVGDLATRNASLAFYDNGILMRRDPLANLSVGWRQDYDLAWDTTGRPGWRNLIVAAEGITPGDYNLTNNSADLIVYVRPLRPDGALSGAGVSLLEPKVGDVVTFNTTVANVGEIPLANLSLVLYDNGMPTGNISIETLGLGESRFVSLDWMASGVGSHNLTLSLEGVTPSDWNLSNNSLNYSIPVRALHRDLALTDLTLDPLKPQEGQEATLSATINNNGEAVVTTAVRLYLGNNRTGALLGQFSVTLQPGDETVVSLPWTPGRGGLQTITLEIVNEYGDQRPQDNLLALEVSVKAEPASGLPWAYAGLVLVMGAVALAGVWRWRSRKGRRVTASSRREGKT